MSHFRDKVVVVTGGSEGIGKALVEAFLLQGAKVATCGRNYDKLYQLQSAHPGQPLLIHAADVSNEQDCRIFIELVIKTFNTIDVLVNNAGISMRALFSDVELSTLHKVMDVNFWGTVYCSHFALPYITAQKGSIVAISSVAGYRGLPGRTAYSASKFAVQGFMEALRTEMLETGVNIMWVCPGFTASNIRNAALTKNGQPQGSSPFDEGTLMTAEKCAEITIDAIEKRKRSVVYTLADKRTVWLNKLMPGITDRLVRRFFFKNDVMVK